MPVEGGRQSPMARVVNAPNERGAPADPPVYDHAPLHEEIQRTRSFKKLFCSCFAPSLPKDAGSSTPAKTSKQPETGKPQEPTKPKDASIPGPDASGPMIVNGINATAVLGMKAKMRENPTMGASFPVKIETELDISTGIVKGPGGMVAAPMPHSEMEGTDTSLPTPLSYCPLFASSCYSLVFLLAAAERKLVLDEFEADSSTTADMGQFYNLDCAKQDKCPWTKVDLDVKVKGKLDEAALQEVGKFAHEHCPASQILRSSAITMSTSVTGKKTAPAAPSRTNSTSSGKHKSTFEPGAGVREESLNGYDLAKYKAFASEIATDAKHGMMQQAGTCVVYCGDVHCADYSGALMQVFSEGHTRGIPTSMDEPIGDGKFPNPIANCFFGTAAFYAHTFALRLSLRGVTISALKTTLSTDMNKRVMMGLEDGLMFKSVNIGVEVECSDASPALLMEVQREADLMCPSIKGFTRSIEFPMRVSQQH